MVGTLHPDEVADLFHRRSVGRIACLAGGEPYLVPLTYAYAGGAAYAHALPGKLVAALRAHPRACFEVDEPLPGGAWRSAVAVAAYEELTDPAERAAALGLLADRDPVARPAAVPGVVFRLRLTGATGRFVTPPAA